MSTPETTIREGANKLAEKQAQRKRVAWRLRTAERRTLLVLGDFLAAVVAAVMAVALWARLDYLGPEPSVEFLRARAPWFVLLPLAWVGLMVNLYDVHRASSWRRTLRGVLLAAAAGSVLYLALFFTTDGSLPRRGVAYFLGLTVVLTLLWRSLYIAVFTAPAFLRRVVIVGAGESGRALSKVIHTLSPSPYELVGLIDDDPQLQEQDIDGVPVLGGSPILLDAIERESVSDVIVAITGSLSGGMFQALLDAQQKGVEITRMPAAYEELLDRVPIHYLESEWLLRSFVDEVRIGGVYLVVKRVLDLVGALLGLSIFALALPWIAIAIAVESGRPVFFRQRRLGKGGQVFRVVKIRTMRQDAEAEGVALWAQEQDPRTTLVGKILRKSHLDEFPQLLNVLRGEMSLVGPRPERPELVAELEKQIPFYRARLLVPPGVTGWAQVSYGKGASVRGSAEKLEYDLYYIKHRGLIMDLWIIVRTIGRVIGFQGV